MCDTAKASDLVFQHTAARRRLALDARGNGQYLAVSTHSRPKAAGVRAGGRVAGKAVSTHSRPKAAGWRHGCRCHFYFCFNTQPPEGGWGFFVFADGCRLRFQHTAARRRLGRRDTITPSSVGFNTQPPEGGWYCNMRRVVLPVRVSTHSRPKAAAVCQRFFIGEATCFNTQPPEGGCRLGRRAESLR